MAWREEMTAAQARWALLMRYQRFEHIVILVLTGLIAIVIVFAIWHLALKIVLSLILAGAFDPTDQTVFQAVSA
jgi:hypothetical protein